MSYSPFARRLPYQSPQQCRRRSTRVEAAVPLVLSGRDAAGQTFRELTETATVNLHGARLKTRNRVLVGMQITAENPATGKAEKAICVRVEEPEPGESIHFIAIQLVHPCNLWQIENPPEDWARVQAEMVDGVTSPSRTTGRVAVMGSGQQQPVVPASPPGSGQLAADVQTRMAGIVETLIANLRRQSEEIVLEAFQQIEERLENSAASLEARMNANAEQALAEFKSGLETFRAESMGETVRDAVRSFSEQMQGVAAEGESRMAERCDVALISLDKALAAFRAEVAEELAARKNEVVEFTDQALRAKVAAMLSSILRQSASAEMEPNRAGPKE